jgi:cellulose synthase operon protein C
MAMVPLEKQSLLKDLVLPQQELYDQLYQLNRALHVHDRATAEKICHTLYRSFPQHRMEVTARRSLAYYDANLLSERECVQSLLTIFEQDAKLQLNKVSVLRELAPRADLLAFLSQICEDPKAHPVFLKEYGMELGLDATEHSKAIRLLRKFIRATCDPVGLNELANILWKQQTFEEALELYRFCAFYRDRDERAMKSYFLALQHMRGTEEGLKILSKRFETLGSQSSGPAMTLAWSYWHAGSIKDSFSVLNQALEKRPDDGGLLLFAAEFFGRYGQHQKAFDLLQKAKGISQEKEWLSHSAIVNGYCGKHTEALDRWLDVLKTEPLNVEAHSAVAQLKARLFGRQEALSYLHEICKKFPNHFRLNDVRLRWAREEGAAYAEPIARELVKLNPAYSDTSRSLAEILEQSGKIEEAYNIAKLCVEKDPTTAVNFTLLGKILTTLSRLDEAKNAFRKAIQLSVDAEGSLECLLELCPHSQDKKAVLDFFESEMVRQVVFGNALFTFRYLAFPLLAPEELLKSLQKAHQARPDLWDSWSVLIHQHTDMKNFDEALKLAQEATQKFPLIPGAWRDLSNIYNRKFDFPAAIQALKKALEINPEWHDATRNLATIYEHSGRFDEMRQLLDTSISRNPFDAYYKGMLADLDWNSGKRKEAVELVSLAVTLEPGYEWGWNALRRWCSELGCPETPSKLARTLTQTRPGEARSWQILSRTLYRHEDFDERIAALDKAIGLSPHALSAYDHKAILLTDHSCFDEAKAVCKSTLGKSEPPRELQAREAWVEYQQGNLDPAIAAIQKLTEKHPDYYWSWELLAEWLLAREKYQEALKASEMLSRLAPHSSIPYAFAADVKVKLNDQKSAKEDFIKALQIDPSYQYAGMRLYELHREDREYVEAEKVVRNLKKSISSSSVDLAELQIILLQDKPEEAQTAFEKFIRSHALNAEIMETILHHFKDNGYLKFLESTLDKLIDEPLVDPEILNSWILCQMSRENLTLIPQFAEWKKRGLNITPALISYISALGEKGKARQFLPKLLKNYRDLMIHDVQLWGIVSYAYTSSGLYSDCVQWCEGYEKRPHIEGWMLQNYALSLMYMDRTEEAYKIHEYAASKHLPKTNYFVHHLHLAFRSAQIGAIDRAKKHLTFINKETLSNYHRVLLHLIEGMIASYQTNQSPKKAFENWRAELKTRAAEFQPDELLIKQFKHAVKCMAKNGKFWAYPVYPNRIDISSLPWWFWWIIVWGGIHFLRSISSH